MKRTLTMALLLTAATMVCCQKESLDLSDNSSTGDGIRTIAVTMPSSRVDIADDGLTVTWKADDKLQLANFVLVEPEGKEAYYTATPKSVFDLTTGAGEKSATFSTTGPGIEAGKKYYLLHSGSTSQFTYPNNKIVITPAPVLTQPSATSYAHIRNGIIYTCTDVVNGDAPDFSSFSPRQSILELRLSLAAASDARLSSLVVKAPGQWFVSSQTFDPEGNVSYTTTDELRLSFASPVEVGANPAEPLVARLLAWWNTDVTAVSGNVQVTLNMDDGQSATVPFAPTRPWTAGAKYKKELSGITGFTASQSDMPVVVGNEFRVFNRAQLQSIRSFNTYSTCFAGKTIKIMNDIDMGGSTAPAWIPLGSDGRLLAGTVDGGGHKLTNLHLASANEAQYSLFGYVGNSLQAAFEVKDLTVDGATLIATGIDATYCAVLIGGAKYAAVTNCAIKNATISTTETGSMYLGCIASHVNAASTDDGAYFTVTGCTLENVTLNSKGSCSSLVVVSMAKDSKALVTISNCYLKNCAMDLTGSHCALVFANITNSEGLPRITISGCTVENCTMSGIAGGSAFSGAIMANAFSGSVSSNQISTDRGLTVTISDCHVKGGAFTTSGGRTIGGICGIAGKKTIIRNCSNSATITTTYDDGGAGANLAGICGYLEAGALVFGCRNTAEVISTLNKNWRTGGIVAFNKGSVTGCYNTGKVQNGASSTSSANPIRCGGGVVGLNYGAAAMVTGSYNNSQVVGGAYTTNIGAICGLNGHATSAIVAGTVENCFWTTVTDQNPALAASASSFSGAYGCTNCGKAPTVWPGVGIMTKGWTVAPSDWNATDWGAWVTPWKTFPASDSGSYPVLTWEN